jgi:hypothetical protein
MGKVVRGRSNRWSSTAKQSIETNIFHESICFLETGGLDKLFATDAQSARPPACT